MSIATVSTALPSDSIRARVREALEREPNAMTVVIARQLDVPEVEVIRALPEDRVVELDASRAVELIKAFEPLGMVHVITNNGVVTLEAFGQFGKFSTMGPYFNVQTKTLDMHIRHEELASVFAVEKPSHMDGVNTLSFQFFKPDGHSAFKVFLTFGSKAPSPERVAQFTELRDRFRLA